MHIGLILLSFALRAKPRPANVSLLRAAAAARNAARRARTRPIPGQCRVLRKEGRDRQRCTGALRNRADDLRHIRRRWRNLHLSRNGRLCRRGRLLLPREQVGPCAPSATERHAVCCTERPCPCGGAGHSTRRTSAGPTSAELESGRMSTQVTDSTHFMAQTLRPDSKTRRASPPRPPAARVASRGRHLGPAIPRSAARARVRAPDRALRGTCCRASPTP